MVNERDPARTVKTTIASRHSCIFACRSAFSAAESVGVCQGSIASFLYAERSTGNSDFLCFFAGLCAIEVTLKNLEAIGDRYWKH